MNLYVNGFRVAVSNDRSEVIFHLLQNGPAFQPDGIISNKEECIGEYVMSEEAAKSFCEHLCQILDVHSSSDSGDTPRLMEADRE